MATHAKAGTPRPRQPGKAHPPAKKDGKKDGEASKARQVPVPTEDLLAAEAELEAAAKDLAKTQASLDKRKAAANLAREMRTAAEKRDKAHRLADEEQAATDRKAEQAIEQALKRLTDLRKEVADIEAAPDRALQNIKSEVAEMVDKAGNGLNRIGALVKGVADDLAEGATDDAKVDAVREKLASAEKSLQQAAAEHKKLTAAVQQAFQARKSAIERTAALAAKQAEAAAAETEHAALKEGLAELKALSGAVARRAKAGATVEFNKSIEKLSGGGSDSTPK